MDRRGGQRTLPHSADAERAVLGAILLDNSQLEGAARILPVGAWYDRRHIRIYVALQAIIGRGAVADELTLKEEIAASGDLEKCGGIAYLASLTDGAPGSANAEHYARIVAEKARRRNIVMRADGLRAAAWNGATPAELDELLEDLASECASESGSGWARSTLLGVLDESTGEVDYVIDRLVPRGEMTILGAGWKTGKTIITYSLSMSASLGSAVFGHYGIPRPVRMVLFQLEMPSREDDRRFRRLAIGLGIAVEEVPRLVESGVFTVFNRPPMNLMNRADLARFHAAIRATDADLVIIDSLLAACASAGVDPNVNDEVRDFITRAFLPLTSEGRAILGLHHKRKKVSGARADEDDRHALLGAQAWGAAAGRIYALERLLGDDEGSIAQPGRARADRSFRCRLSLVGSWTPEESPDVVIEVRDVEGGGTTVQVLQTQEQLRRGGVTATQRAAIRIAEIARERLRVPLKWVLVEVKEQLGTSTRTVEDGLALARTRGWVTSVPSEGRHGRKGKALDLVPGEVSDGV